MIKFTDYKWDNNNNKQYTLPAEVISIEIVYSEGLLWLYINGEKAYYSASVGDGFNLIVNNDNLEDS